MLKNISPLISPSLLKILAEMGHGDEIVFSDAHFPGHTFNHTVLRADGLNADSLLGAVIPLFELDAYATPVIMMGPGSRRFSGPRRRSQIPQGAGLRRRNRTNGTLRIL